jgi:hypothetical protein
MSHVNNNQLKYHHKFEKWYIEISNAVVTKQPLEHYYLSHATFPFPPDRFLRQAVVYYIQQIFGFLGQFLAA